MSESQNATVHGRNTDVGDRYQWLNRYALFSGGYREDALDCMKNLIQKYGMEEEEDDDSDLS